MTRRVEIFLGSEQIDVRLWLIVFIQMNRSLNSDKGSVSNQARQEVSGAQYGGVVPWPDRTHCEDFSVNEFHSIVLAQNTCLHHAVIFVSRKQSPRDFCFHNLTLRISQARG